ncbi:MAG: ABC transporter substrate-binding protein [Burkholderiaceae bacterium]|jgi:phospholipid transport system substrate-binding protein|nr:ABC transporter substrate-binding protein [Burkholderiaceae bacterium]
MKNRLTRRFVFLAALLIAGAGLAISPKARADEAPDAMIARLSQDVLDTIKADKSLQSGNLARVMALADSKVMPYVDFRRMTAAAAGPAWRRATPAQQQQLQDEFKTLLVRTYSNGLRQVSNQTVQVQPMRAAPGDQEVVVRTFIRGSGEPVQMDYRLYKTPGDGTGWKVYDFNVMGIWIIDTYRSQFAQQINAGGIERLLQTLTELNKSNSAR